MQTAPALHLPQWVLIRSMSSSPPHHQYVHQYVRGNGDLQIYMGGGPRPASDRGHTTVAMTPSQGPPDWPHMYCHRTLETSTYPPIKDML